VAYLSVLILAIAIIVGVPVFFASYDSASCTDGKQNGDELGIDCGGSCRQLCDFQRPTPAVLWSRIDRVVSGIYNAVAYVENTNLDVGVQQISYSFRLYDANGILVSERRGITSIPPNKAFAIFEGGIDTGERTPVRVNFEFTSPFVWQPATNLATGIRISGKQLTEKSGLPRVEATAENTSLAAISNLELVALIYDASDNIVAFSRTKVDFLDKGTSAPVVFTWPEKFSASVSKVEILVRTVGL
jgi:hypothetical protein